MVDHTKHYDKMTVEELERGRAEAQEQIEALLLRFKAMGLALERKREVQELEHQKAAIEEQLDDLNPPAQTVGLKTLIARVRRGSLKDSND